MKKLLTILFILGVLITPVMAQTEDTLKITLNLTEMATVEWFTEEEPTFDNWEYSDDVITLTVEEDNLSFPVWLGVMTNRDNIGTLKVTGTALLKDGTDTSDVIPITLTQDSNTKEFASSTSEELNLTVEDENTGYRIIPIEMSVDIDHNDVILKTAPSVYEATFTATYTEP